MIVVRAPMRVSFVGGGTDLPDFYHQYPGCVISAAIDKFVYIVINRTPLIDRISARYSISETVRHSSELQHTRIRAALIDLGIEKNIEIGSFASLPAKTGLGSSSSFSVALLQGLHVYTGKSVSKHELARLASRLEIELAHEPIGKQDQYAASFGGLNMFRFNPDDTVDVEPILLDYRKRSALEDHLALFFTGITRSAADVLREQRANTPRTLDTLKEMADSVSEFKKRLLVGDMEGLGRMLHAGWLRKKSLASSISNSFLDDLYASGMDCGAWGGKVTGAGGGGCMMFLMPPERKAALREAIKKVAEENNLAEWREIPIRFVQSGAEVLFNGDYHLA